MSFGYKANRSYRHLKVIWSFHNNKKHINKLKLYKLLHKIKKIILSVQKPLLHISTILSKSKISKL